MLSRRYLRIKVMQALYSFLSAKEDNLTKGEKSLFQSIDRIFDLYLHLVSIMVETRNMGLKLIDERKNKRLPSQEDLHPNLKFVENPILVKLAESIDLENQCKKRKISWVGEQDIIRKFFMQLIDTELYNDYMNNGKDDFETHRMFVLGMYEMLAGKDYIEHYFEEIDVHWIDDIFFVHEQVAKLVRHISGSKEKTLTLPSIYKDYEEDREFVTRLFRECIIHNKAFEERIATYTQNWETERIAAMDMLLMKMAHCEFTRFPSIPVKVTLNEYIELAKQFSTDKSKVFVNGILDKLLSDLKDSGEMQKFGRGLMQ